MRLSVICLSIISFTLSLNIYAGSVVPEIPSEPDTSEIYIFYLHGSAEEVSGSSEKYEAAVDAIAESSATVISEIRDVTDPNAYANKIKAQVNTLITKGVPSKNITISGFSKGSIITLASAVAIDNPDINFVLLAGCSEYLNEKYNVDSTKAVGRILSIYDEGDEKFGACEGVIKASNKLKFEEIGLDSGKGHKLFRIPIEKFIEQWRDPLVDWAGA